MRRAARVDANQAAVVAALRNNGATVQCLHQIGSGVPDLLVAYRSQTFCVEVKDGAKPPSKRRLTPDEVAWHEAWGAPVYVIESVADALRLLTKLERVRWCDRHVR